MTQNDKYITLRIVDFMTQNDKYITLRIIDVHDTK